MPTVHAVPGNCPKCGGKLWDNRATKKSPKMPDFKCRDKACDTPIWPLKDGGVWADQVAGVQRPADYNTHGDLPNDPARPTEMNDALLSKLATVTAAYDQCFAHAIQKAKEAHATAGVPVTLEGVSAIAATLLIQVAKAA